ncbi:MAG TPA: helical backbone metal receptor [Gemmatimonadales bacterium]|nr:helical backbone metal receptor [Gemmatimonadales bacterium]
MALVLLAGCLPVANDGGSLVLQDDAGREVRLEAPARRVASLIPATTEWLFALGAGELVVGRTAWCDYPAEATAVASLGDGILPNVEAIVAAAPDLTLLYDSPANLNAAERLTALGIPVLLLRTDGLDDLDRQLALLGRAIGRGGAADSLRADIRERLVAVSVPLRADAPSVLIIAWDQPPITLGQGSFLSEVLERAGGRNLFADISAASASISIEAVVARDPDLVLVTGADSLPAFASRPEWAVVPAVRDRRFLRVQGSEFNRPGPRTPDAILELRAALEQPLP